MTTGIILRPFPFETIPHWLARHIRISGLTNFGVFYEYLTGRRDLAFSYDLPSRLDILVDKFRLDTHFNSNDLIDNHTLFPFYSRFLPKSRQIAIRDQMKMGNSSGIHTRIGIVASDISSPTAYRMCPFCVEEDLKQYGEPYFHLEHQFPSITVCPYDGAILREIDVSFYELDRANRTISAQEIDVQLPKGNKNNFQRKQHGKLWQMAKDAFWLLNNPSPFANPQWIRNRYLQLLRGKGLASFTSERIRVTDLVHAFESFYSQTLLSWIGCPLNRNINHNWLANIVRKRTLIHHPIYHISLMQFLGVSAEDFFCADIGFEPFGQAPWPCLNTPCPHFHQGTIYNIEITSKSKKRQPVGIFLCPHCDFTYSRFGPDKSGDDVYRRDRIINFGTLWEKTLREYWAEGGYTFRKLGEILGVGHSTVKKQAILLGLITDIQDQPCSTTQDQSGTSSSSLVEKKRNQWLGLMEKYPDYGITRLRKIEPSLYAWLYRNDQVWFKENVPKAYASRKIPTSYIDWDLRDIVISVSCMRAIIDIITPTHKPIYLTKNRIRQDSHYGPVLGRSADKLPISTNIVQRYVESRQDFAIRRIWFVTQKWHKEGNGWLSHAKLIRLSCTEHVQKWGIVELTLNQALEWNNERFFQTLKRNPSFLKTLFHEFTLLQ